MSSLSGPALSEDEKARIRYHLGYPAMSSVQTFIGGFPASIQTNFLLEGNMDKVQATSLSYVRATLTKLDAAAEQMFGDMELMAINRIDTIEVNQKEQQQLEAKYNWYRCELANYFCTIPNPFDQRFMNRSGGGINVPVVG